MRIKLICNHNSRLGILVVPVADLIGDRIARFDIAKLAGALIRVDLPLMGLFRFINIVDKEFEEAVVFIGIGVRFIFAEDFRIAFKLAQSFIVRFAWMHFGVAVITPDILRLHHGMVIEPLMAVRVDDLLRHRRCIFSDFRIRGAIVCSGGHVIVIEHADAVGADLQRLVVQLGFILIDIDLALRGFLEGQCANHRAVVALHVLGHFDGHQIVIRGILVGQNLQFKVHARAAIRMVRGFSSPPFIVRYTAMRRAVPPPDMRIVQSSNAGTGVVRIPEVKARRQVYIDGQAEWIGVVLHYGILFAVGRVFINQKERHRLGDRQVVINPVGQSIGAGSIAVLFILRHRVQFRDLKDALQSNLADFIPGIGVLGLVL